MLPLWRNDATAAFFAQPVAYIERLQVAHTGRLRVAHTRRLRVAHTGRLRVAHTRRLQVAHTGRLRVAHTRRLQVAHYSPVNDSQSKLSLAAFPGHVRTPI